jgi:hypothetical protein
MNVSYTNTMQERFESELGKLIEYAFEAGIEWALRPRSPIQCGSHD